MTAAISRTPSSQPVISLAVGMLSRVSGQVVALVVTLIGAHYLTPAEFGIYAISAAIITIIRTLLYSATFQYLMQNANLKTFSSECLAINGLTALLCSVVALVALGVGGAVFGGTDILTLFLLMAPSNVISAVTAWSEAQVLRAGHTTKYYSATASGEVISGLAAVAMLMAGFGNLSFVPMVYVRAIFLLVAYCMITRPQFSSRLDFARLGEITRWAMPQYAAALAGLFSNYGADFLIGAILSPAATGIYRAASRISGAVSDVAAQPVRLIATTIYSRRRAAGAAIDDLWPQIAALAVFIALPALGGLAAVANLLLPSMFGAAWGHLDAVVAVLCLGRLLATVSGVATPFLVAHNRQKQLLPVQIVAGIVLILGLMAFARWGVVAAAIITTVSTCLGSFIYIALASRAADNPGRAFVKLIGIAALPGICSTVTALVAAKAGLMPDGPVLAGLCVALAVVVWGVAVWVLRRNFLPMLKSLEAGV